MKYTGYAVTYAPEEEINKHNYFLNGIINDVSENSSCTDQGFTYGRRGLFAMFDGSCSESHGEDAAWICAYMLQEYIDHNFDSLNREYFQSLNEALKGRAFEENGRTVSAALGVVYTYGNSIKAYNIGETEIYYICNRDKEIKRLSGEIPEYVEVEETQEDESGEVYIDSKKVKSVPYVGYMSEECIAAPHISDEVRIYDGDLIFMATKSLIAAVKKNELPKILKKSKISPFEKIKMIVDLAVERNPHGNYTAQIICAKDGKKILGIKTRLLAWGLAALIALGGIGFTVSSLKNANGDFLKEIKRLVTLFTYRDMVEEVEVDPWVPLGRQDEEEEESDKTELAEQQEVEPQSNTKKDNSSKQNYQGTQEKQQQGHVSGVDNVKSDNTEADKEENEDAGTSSGEIPGVTDEEQETTDAENRDVTHIENQEQPPISDDESENDVNDNNQNEE